MPELRENPYRGIDWSDCEFHLAQFHTHTDHPPTDGHSGSDPPGAVIDAYSDAGYSALTLNEHEYNVETTTWPWTEWDRDPADLDMAAVEGAELGGTDDCVPHELLSLFADLVDTTGMTVHDALAELDARDGLAVFAHPGRFYDPDECDWYVEYFDAHDNALGLEVANAADRYPDDRDVWDGVQTALGNDRAVWGFANDDYHGEASVDHYSFDRSRNVLVLDSLSPETVRDALVDGRFFYQHARGDDDPPDVDAVGVDADRGEIAVSATGCETVEWISEGEVVHRGDTLAYRDVDRLGAYVRARLVSPGGSETGLQPLLFESA